MLHRKDGEGIVLISQPAHGWVAGQLARNWGNRDFAPFSESVCLAAEQHDIGFIEWEQRPTLNRQTGLPHTFLEMPTPVHLRIWSSGIAKLLRLGRYPALLVSRHFTALAQRLLPEKEPLERPLVERFLDQQATFQSALHTSLQNDFFYADLCSEDQIRSAQETVSMLDWFSLQILLRFGEERLRDFPANPTATRFTMKSLNESDTEIGFEPWPFATETVTLICEGRRLLSRFTDQRALRQALRAAAPATLVVRLCSR